MGITNVYKLVPGGYDGLANQAFRQWQSQVFKDGDTK